MIFVKFSICFLLCFIIHNGCYAGEESAIINDSLNENSNLKDQNIFDGYSLGVSYANLSFEADRRKEGIYHIHANQYNLSLNWRKSLFELHGGFGICNLQEYINEYSYNHYVLPTVITKAEELINKKSFQFNLYCRLFISKRWHLTPFIWTGYNSINSTSIIPILGVGLQYCLPKKFFIEVGVSENFWNETRGNDYEWGAGYIPSLEIGICKKIFSGTQ